ncbi:MAG: exodeoxyribonuclease VII large subunit [Tenericutes bacterium]|nr:exodeoxyribonuclease VII large subunit [Mycoplasmatota bacterium]
MERKYLTVTALNRYLKYKFDNDMNLQKILLKAEISNFKRHSRGHLYLTLKDDKSEISAVMFLSDARTLNFLPKDGNQVIVEGHLSVYEVRGTYQIYIKNMSLDGVGDLYLAYERLKEELAKAGLFNEEHKLPLPKYPRTVGVITSETGAAVRDVINVIGIRYPITKIIVYPALVQGPNAKNSIVSQIEAANNDGLVDVLIVGRGGGSIEDLWAFNEEIVARAIYNSRIPIISAVGHETDTTIADFVSDKRASTPSHAAEICVPDQKDIIDLLNNYSDRLSVSLSLKHENNQKYYNQVVSSTVFKNPEKILESTKLKLLYLEDKLNAYKPSKQIEHYQDNILSFNNRLIQRMEYIILNKSKDFLSVTEKLELVNPLAIMKKGYTVVKQKDVIKKSVKEIDQSAPLVVDFYDGTVDCKIIEVKQ